MIIFLAILASCATCITLLVCCFVPGCLIHRERILRASLADEEKIMQLYT
jgi:hypothetical protein